MESYPARSHGSACHAEKKYDMIRFVDLTFVMDWTKFFDDAIDKRIQLGVKGPHTNHCFIFEARGFSNENGEDIRQVITSCRRFMSPTGKDVPMILPDLSPEHWKEYKKLSKKPIIEYDPTNCGEEISLVLNQRVTDTNELIITSETTLLGLRVFKISNNENYIFNILQKTLLDSNLEIAPFENKIKGHMIYHYCHHIRTNIGRYSEDEKHQVLLFMETKFPPKLIDINKGFSKDASKEFVNCTQGKSFLFS
jgi:hypothetical protein